MKLKTKNDTFEVFWWGPLLGLPAVYSEKYDFFFTTPSSYKDEISRRRELVDVLSSKPIRNARLWGYSSFQAAQKLGVQDLGASPGLVMYEIDLRQVRVLLALFPGLPQSSLKDDFLVIPCPSKEKARKIAETIPGSLAGVLALDGGLVVYSNEEFEK